MVKNLPANEGDARDTDLIPGLGRSPGVGNSNPLLTWRIPGKGRTESDMTEATKQY